MAKTKLKTLSTEQLKNKGRSLKLLIGVFTLLSAYLFFQVIRDYSNMEELDWGTIAVAICTLIGPITIYPELKEIQAELTTRS